MSSGLAGQLGQARVPRREPRVALAHAAQRLHELDGTPDPELVPVVLGRGALEVGERPGVVVGVVEQVAEVDARLDVVRVDGERALERLGGALVVAQPVQRVAHARHRLGVVGRLPHGGVEVALGLLDLPLAEERAPHLEHQLDVVLVAQLEGALERAERLVVLAELHQHLAEPGEGVLVLGVEGERVVEGAGGAHCVLLARQPGVPDPDVQLHPPAGRGRAPRE
jgi:hypothetical protein